MIKITDHATGNITRTEDVALAAALLGLSTEETEWALEEYGVCESDIAIAEHED